MVRIAATFVTFLLCLTVEAQTPNPTSPPPSQPTSPPKPLPLPKMPTWFVFGYMEKDSTGKTIGEYLLYKGTTVLRRKDGHIEVWVKSVAGEELAKRYNENGGNNMLTVNALNLIANRYVPPWIKAVDNTDKNLITNVIFAETTASDSDAPYRLMMLVEIDCEGHMQRTLSATMISDGRRSTVDAPGEWGHTYPDSSGEAMEKILCSPQ